MANLKRLKFGGITEEIRNIIESFNGERFFVSDVYGSLDDRGICYDPASPRSILYQMAKKGGYIEKIATKGRLAVYRECNSRRESVPNEAEIRPSEVAIAIAAGLQKFSSERLKYEFLQYTDYDEKQFKSTANNVIARLSARGQLLSSNTRPVVYNTTGKFYRDFSKRIPRLLQAAPFMRHLIEKAFGEHIEAEYVKQRADQKPEIILNPEEDPTHYLTPADIGGAVLAYVSELLAEREGQNTDRSPKAVDQRLFNAQQRLVTTTNQKHALEAENKKLIRRLELLQKEVDASRVKLAAKHRLDERRESRPNKSAGFALGEMATITKENRKKKKTGRKNAVTIVG